MNTNIKFIPMYKIAEELYKEGLDSGQTVSYKFSDYYSGVMKKFKEILSGLGMDYESLKNIDEDEYKIALSQKENIKEMIKSYKSKPVRLARQQKYNEIPTDDLRNIVNKVDNIIRESLDNSKYDKEISNIYLNTRIAYDEKVNNLRKDGIGKIINDVEYLKPLELDKTLSELDKVALLNYYMQLISEASFKFRAIVDKVSLIRENEIVDIGFDMVEKNLNEEEFWSRITESCIAIWEAEKLFDDELILKYQRLKNKISKEELDAVERLLKERK